MCGIVGYLGDKDAAPILLGGLKRLEYRGYDSAGIAVISDDKKVNIIKKSGKIINLENELLNQKPQGVVGIGHTRWATHGAPNETNAHPHSDCSGKIALIHNGIIENYAILKQMLISKGHTIKTDTDTEIIAHLIEELYTNGTSFEDAFRGALQEIKGAYGFVVLNSDEPEKIYVARQGSPLVVGFGDNEYFVASDAPAIIQYTKDVFYLEDGEYAVITRKGVTTKTIQNEVIDKKIIRLNMDLEEIEKGGFDHFMLKEIFEQPQTIADAMRGRIIEEEGITKLGGLTEIMHNVLRARRILITACGTSYHAGLIGEYMLEQYARVPVEVEYASEFRYRDPIVQPDDLVIVISQSGETADTLAALREAKRRGATVMGIVNVVGSTIARETDGGVYIHAGPEIGVASTKAFTSQVTVLALLTIMIARAKTMSFEQGKDIINHLRALPDLINKVLETNEIVKSIANEFKNAQNFLYLGRGYNYPVALEGALKLKEISYIHAEGYPAAEMKHGPIALIDENMPVVFIATRDAIYEKVVSNIEEVISRGGKVIALVTEGDHDLDDKVDYTIPIPQTSDLLQPIVSIIPLQLLSYHVAVLRGTNVDQPRNLAKSVTVE